MVLWTPSLGFMWMMCSLHSVQPQTSISQASLGDRSHLCFMLQARVILNGPLKSALAANFGSVDWLQSRHRQWESHWIRPLLDQDGQRQNHQPPILDSLCRPVGGTRAPTPGLGSTACELQSPLPAPRSP